MKLNRILPLLFLLLGLLTSSCQTTNHYTFIVVEQGATATIKLDTQFSTQKTTTPTTDLSVPLMGKDVERRDDGVH